MQEQLCKINNIGALLVNRAGRYIVQYCPFCADDFCGHHCPMFVEMPATDAVTGDAVPGIFLGCSRNDSAAYRLIEDRRNSPDCGPNDAYLYSRRDPE
jgi:hypothetical protein